MSYVSATDVHFEVTAHVNSAIESIWIAVGIPANQSALSMAGTDATIGYIFNNVPAVGDFKIGNDKFFGCPSGLYCNQSYESTLSGIRSLQRRHFEWYKRPQECFNWNQRQHHAHAIYPSS